MLFLKDFSILSIAKQKLYKLSMFSQLKYIVLFCRKKKKQLTVGKRGLSVNTIHKRYEFVYLKCEAGSRAAVLHAFNPRTLEAEPGGSL